MTPTLHDPAAERSVLGAILIDPECLTRIRRSLSPELFYESNHRLLYQAILSLWEKGQAVEPVSLAAELREAGDLETLGGLAFLSEVWDYTPTSTHVEQHVKLLRQKYTLREVVRIGEGMVASVQSGKHSTEKILERALNRLTGVMVHGVRDRPMSKEDIIARELAAMNEEENRGVTLPYEKIGRYTGELISGDFLAIPGYSNSGKTLFTSNLTRHFGIQGVPCIIFPTESQEKFISRMAAAHARVPQAIAERGAWHLASEQQREDYEFALKDIATFPWELIPQRSITPEEIIAHTAAARQKFKGQRVVVVVDHAHRLNYGGITAALMVDQFTMRLRNFIGEDADGMIGCVLYQPKKPQQTVRTYQPVTGYDIAGGGNVMAECDIILSPYRRWVKVEPDWKENPYHRTPWGAPKAKLKEGGIPEPAKPESEGAKLDDEHVYVKIAKRRTGGEGPTVMLNIDAPSGYIYQIGSDQPGATGTDG